MSLPRKRKRLSEGDPHEVKGHIGHTEKRSPEESVRLKARTDQMERAFEIVDRIGDVQGDPDRPEPPHHDISQNHQDFLIPGELRMRISIDSPTAGKNVSGIDTEGSPPPTIEVKLTIPSFLWKIPVLGGVTRSLIRKFSKGQT